MKNVNVVPPECHSGDVAANYAETNKLRLIITMTKFFNEFDNMAGEETPQIMPIFAEIKVGNIEEEERTPILPKIFLCLPFATLCFSLVSPCL